MASHRSLPDVMMHVSCGGRGSGSVCAGKLAMSGKALREGRVQDGLKYSIRFPATTDANEVGIKAPVVYLLGWASAKDSHLTKYSSIYEREGCITIQYIHPEDRIYLLSSTTISELEEAAEKLCQLLDDHDLKKNPVVVHSFSNSGSAVYRYMADVFPREKINMIGVILDSGPCKLELQSGLKAVYFGHRQKGWLMCGTYIGRFLWHLATFAARYGYPTSLFYEPIATSKLHQWPFLFLYSTNDGVSAPQQILDVCAARKVAGSAFVRSHDFEDSPHVQHLRFHPAEYTELCVSFLDEILRRFNEGGTSVGHRSSSVDPAIDSSSENQQSTPGAWVKSTLIVL